MTRLHSYLGDLPPSEFEAAFYDAQRTDQRLVEIQ
jgi:putative transposase